MTNWVSGRPEHRAQRPRCMARWFARRGGSARTSAALRASFSRHSDFEADGGHCRDDRQEGNSMAEARRGGEQALVAGARALSRAASNPALRLDVIRLPLLAPARRDCTRFVRVVAKVLTDARGRVRELEILEGGGAEADATVRDAARELILERNPASDGDPLRRLVPFDVCSAGGAHGDAERPTLGSARGQR